MDYTVSIILPTYNGARYLLEAIDSCLTQTYESLELIVVDDCSTDETPSILARVDDKRVKRLRNATNQGLPRSLNIGFNASKGNYLTWTSDDNLFAPRAIEKMVSYLDEHAEVAFVYADHWNIDLAGRTIGQVCFGPPSSTGELTCLGMCCFLYRRIVYETIGDYDPSAALAEDYDYWLRVRQHFKMRHIDEHLYHYRLHPTSLTSQHGIVRQQQAMEKVKTKWIGPNPYIYPSRYARSLSRKYMDFAFDAYKERSFQMTRRFVIKALMLDPRWVRNRGVLSILFESVMGTRVANKLRLNKSNRRRSSFH
jgi:glycosyltransferase involved in cell wall biosynthesis